MYHALYQHKANRRPKVILSESDGGDVHPSAKNNFESKKEAEGYVDDRQGQAAVPHSEKEAKCFNYHLWRIGLVSLLFHVTQCRDFAKNQPEVKLKNE